MDVRDSKQDRRNEKEWGLFYFLKVPAKNHRAEKASRHQLQNSVGQDESLFRAIPDSKSFPFPVQDFPSQHGQLQMR